jgi:hypothetical protein
MTISKARAWGAALLAGLWVALAGAEVQAQPVVPIPPAAQSPGSVATTRRPIAPESERPIATRRTIRGQWAASPQYAWQYPGYGYGTPPAWGYGGYGFGYAPGWNYPGYPSNYFPTWGGYYGGYGVGPGSFYPGAIGTGFGYGSVAGGSMVGGAGVSSRVVSTPYIGSFPGDKFGVNRDTTVNGGSYATGQGVVGPGVLPRGR